MQTLKALTDRLMATGDRRVTRRVRHWKTADGAFSAFYFVSERCRGRPVEVYAVRGVPRGEGPLPGILHIHGGGQTANPDHVARLVRRGYVCLSLDWTGPAEGRRHVTQWRGVDLELFTADPTRSFLVHAAAACRQALTVLADHPRVDASRLGAFGISWGGYLMWLVNGTDPRLRAAVAIYGCGDAIEPTRPFLPDGAPTGQAKRLWKDVLDPVCFANRQSAPMLFLNGTNDFFGWMPTIEQMGRRLEHRHRVSFDPHQNHCIAELTPALEAWFESLVKGTRRFPSRPEMELAQRRSSVLLTSRLLPGARHATFFVAAKDHQGPALCWRPLKPRRRGRTVEVEVRAGQLPVQGFSCYVHQTFADGVQLSSLPRCGRLPAATAQAEPGPTAIPLDACWWFAPVGTEPFLEPIRFSNRRRKGQTVLVHPSRPDRHFSFNTRIVTDRRWWPPAQSALRCALEGPVAEPITVVLVQHYRTRRERAFTATCSVAELAAGVSLARFRDKDARPLRARMALSLLTIDGWSSDAAEVTLADVHWTRI